MPQGHGRLLVTGVRLTQTLQDLGRQVDLTAVFVDLAKNPIGMDKANEEEEVCFCLLS